MIVRNHMDKILTKWDGDMYAFVAALTCEPAHPGRRLVERKMLEMR